MGLPSLKLTAKAPENDWLEYDRFLLGQFGPIFRGKLAVSFRECMGACFWRLVIVRVFLLESIVFFWCPCVSENQIDQFPFPQRKRIRLSFA